jgi:hypothetical protein
LISSTPVIPKENILENILLIEGIYDLSVKVQPFEELWQKVAVAGNLAVASWSH